MCVCVCVCVCWFVYHDVMLIDCDKTQKINQCYFPRFQGYDY